MKTNLTLSIEQDVLKRAKEYAKTRNRSLSDIIENYLKILTHEESQAITEKHNPIIESLRGSFKMPKNDMDYKAELRNRSEEKYQ